MQATQKNREDIPEEYKWRMEDIYPDTAAWERDLAALLPMGEQIAAYAGRLGDEEALISCLLLDEKLSMLLEKVYGYARMLQDLDNASPAAQSMQEQALSLLFRLQEMTAFLLPELTALDPVRLREIAERRPELRDFRHMIDNVIRSRAHVLSAREEQLLAMAAPALESMDNAFSMLDSVDLDRGEVEDEDGSRVSLTDGLFARMRESRDRRVRADAFAALHGAFQKMGNTIAALYAGQVKADVFAARVRGYEDSLDAALFADALPRSIYTGLIGAVRAALPVYFRYLELRRRLLGVDRLHIYDCYVPVVEMPETAYTYEQAKAVVLDTLTPLGDGYIRDLKDLFSGGKVDVYETPGKTTGAYATDVYGVHPYMLLNFAGQLGDVFTLAHEAGHCLHTHYSNSQPYVNKDYPIFLAEIASTVNENILMRGLISRCDASTEEGRREKAFLINRYLEEFRGTVFRQTMFAEFELEVHRLAEAGEPLTAETLCGVYHRLLEAYFGPDVVIDAYMDWEWARIPHFYRAFYVFKYATGFSAAAAISRRILDGGEVAPYLDFLHAGGSDYPAETLKRAGVDMSTPAPVEEALREFADLVDEMERLIG